MTPVEVGGGGGGGGGFHQNYGKTPLECLIQIPFYTVNYTYIRNSITKRFLSSFKTLVLVADQSLAANLTNVSKFRKSKIYNGKSAADFFRWAAKN